MARALELPHLDHANQRSATDLRVDSLYRLLVMGAAIGMAWHFYVAVVAGSTDLWVWSSPLILIGVSLCAYWAIARGTFLPAVYLYIAGVTTSVLLAAWTYGEPSALLLLAMPVGIAALLVGPQAGFFTAALVCLVLGLEMHFAPAPVLSVTIAWLAGISAILTALLLWIAMVPLRTALHWAWTGYEQAQQKTEEARRHRAQMTQLLKDLDAANRRLKNMAHELERARRAANEARRLKAEFAANISHELRTPLNLIIGFSEMMALAPHTYGTPLPAAYRGDIQVIYRNGRHLSTLIDDVLDLSQIEAGRMGLLREPTSVPEVIQEAIATVRSLFQNKGLWIRTQIAPDLPLIEADRTRVRQVLINLLNNAVRFTEEGGVSVHVHADQQEVNIQVSDTGIGIHDHDLPKLFQEFSRLDRMLSQRTGGSGLGLAISKKFVELHGGRIRVDSQQDVGTTIAFSLPLREEMGISRTPPDWETWVRMPPAQSRQQTILVLAENPSMGRFFKRYLDDYQVLFADSAQEAWQLAEQQPIHALVMVADSGEEGWSKLRRVRERLPAMPVMVCTVRGAAFAVRLPGVLTYLVKPVSQERFLDALTALDAKVQSLLLVDDDPEVVRLLRRMVGSAPRTYHTHTAYSGAQALSFLHAQRPDAVVLDLLMPEVDGYTVLEHMQDDPELRHTPVIVVTAKGLEEEVVTAGLVGMTRREGFSVGEMMRCLKANLDALAPRSQGQTR